MKILTVILVGFFSISLGHAALAQTWPNKPIRMLVGFPPGGPTDVVARLVSDKVAAQIGQRIIIDNLPGAAGNIAVEILAKSTPDGHTLLYSSNAIALVVTTWQGLFAPAGIPAPVLGRVNAEFVKAVHSPELKPKIEQQDMDPTGLSVKEFSAAYRAELARWTKVARDAGLKAD